MPGLHYTCQIGVWNMHALYGIPAFPKTSSAENRDVNGTRFSRVPTKFPVPGKKIPERENFGKLRTIHRYKIPWQQFVSQRTPHNGRCLMPGGVRWAASFRSQQRPVFAN